MTDVTIHQAWGDALSRCVDMPDNPIARALFAHGVAWAIDAAFDDLDEEAWHRLAAAMTEFLVATEAKFFREKMH